MQLAKSPAELDRGNVKRSNSRFFGCTNKRVRKESVELLSSENEIRSKLIR